MSNIINLLNKHSYLLVAIALSCIPILNLINPGLPIGHDTQDHVARIANFYSNLEEGTIIPRWAGNLNWGYGHPILIFLYPLPSYFASFFHFIGFSLINSVKVVFALSYLASGMFMYLWTSRMLGNRAGLVAAVLYQFAPYRFVDLYVRGALGEHVFFVFPPLVCLGIWQFVKVKSRSSFALISLSIAGMILSHNALTIMFLPFIALYFVALLMLEHKSFKEWLIGGLSIVIGFGLSAFFWIPAFFEGKYTLRDIVIENTLLERFEPLNRLLYSAWDYGGHGQFSVQVGIAHWAVIVISTTMLLMLIVQIKNQKSNFKNSDQRSKFLLFALSYIFFWISIFLILEYSSSIYKTITLFQKFQFPWRWLSLTVFTTSVLGGLAVYYFPKKYVNHFAILIIILAIFSTLSFWRAKDYKQYDSIFFTDVYYGTTDTGESSPIWSVRFMLDEPEEPAEVIEGRAEIWLVNRTNIKHSYLISVDSDQARVKENTLYFPGWYLYVDGEKMPVESIQFQDREYHGIITFNLSKGEHEVSLVFENTKIRTLANSISAIFMIMIIIIASIRLQLFKSDNDK